MILRIQYAPWLVWNPISIKLLDYELLNYHAKKFGAKIQMVLVLQYII